MGFGAVRLWRFSLPRALFRGKSEDAEGDLDDHGAGEVVERCRAKAGARAIKDEERRALVEHRELDACIGVRRRETRPKTRAGVREDLTGPRAIFRALYFLLLTSILLSSLAASFTSLSIKEMFKRVDKRRKRKEEEEELGIDEEMKEAMGLNDTDSDESASSEEEDEHSGSDSEAGDGREAGSDENTEGDDAGDEDSEDEEDASEDDEPTLSVGDALLKPVRSSADGDHSTCVFCPHAILKHDVMVRVHLDSKVRLESHQTT